MNSAKSKVTLYEAVRFAAWPSAGKEMRERSMVKKIAVINDLSGFGRCSLTAAIPVISVMGAQPCPLPTAVLSGQTGYPSYYCDDYTEKMEYFRQEWEKMEVAFDGIYTGYVANEAQIAQIFRFLDTFYKEGSLSHRNRSEEGLTRPGDVPKGGRPFLLVDPVMGDEGRVYKMFTPNLLEQMKCLAARADVITPNLTELCLLTGNDFRELNRLAGRDIQESERGNANEGIRFTADGRNGNNECFLTAIERMALEMIAKGPRAVVVTGIHLGNLDDEAERSENRLRASAGGSEEADNLPEKSNGGSERIGNLAVVKKTTCQNGGGAEQSEGTCADADETITSKLVTFPYVGGSFSGTGDLFASVLAGGMARGDDIFQSVELAGKFIEHAMKDAAADGVERNDGANFEKYLGMLMAP